jgi:uncharacterized membrane protein YoaK (UPF0700 family)
MNSSASNHDVRRIPSVTLPTEENVNQHPECATECRGGTASNRVTRPVRAKSYEPGNGASATRSTSGSKSIPSVRWSLHDDNTRAMMNDNNHRRSWARQRSSVVVVEIDRAELDRRSSTASTTAPSSSQPSAHEDSDTIHDNQELGIQPPSANHHQQVSIDQVGSKDASGFQGKSTAEGSFRKMISRRIKNFADNTHKKVFGDKYSKRESGFVILAGALIALNSGLVNGSCMSGFLFPEGESVSIAGFTSDYTQSGLAMAAGDWSTYAYHSYIIFSYILGAFLSGFVTPDATPYQIEPTYGPTFLVGGFFLLTASFLAMSEYDTTLVFCCAGVSNGIQNGIASIYSANLVRCSLTGATTDLALVAAQILRGNRKGMWKGFVLAIIVVSFWTGGLISFFLTRRYRSHTLFFNACLCFLIGLLLVVFLVREVGISFRTAVFGTWRWKKAIGKLHKSVTNCEESKEFTKESLLNMFDDLDIDGNGFIDNNELLDKFLLADFRITAKEVRALIKSVDENGDGKIDRESWSNLVSQIVD